MSKVHDLLGMEGNMISGSKSYYRSRFPDHFVAFNANVCNESGKIWYGDIDISLSKEDLIELSVSMRQNIYVLSEMDGRFENENSPKIEKSLVVFFPDGGFEIRESLKEFYTL